MAFNSYMHERNIYRNQPDFAKIALEYPAFRKYAIPDAKGKKVRVDFTDPEALRMVTEILLKKDFNLDVEIPKGFLIPTVPQRLNYILWLEDLLTKVPGNKKDIIGVDIGLPTATPTPQATPNIKIETLSVVNHGDGHMTSEEIERHLEAKQSLRDLLPEKTPLTVPVELFSNEPSVMECEIMDGSVPDISSTNVIENQPVRGAFQLSIGSNIIK